MKIALIAHDKKKNEIIELSKKYKDVLSQHELYATGTTGTLIMGETGLTIHRMKSGPLGGDPLIPDENGNFTRPVNFRKRYYRILKAAGIETKGLHSLRHTFATNLVNGIKQPNGSIKSLPPRQVADLLGHTTSEITELYYVKRDLTKLNGITDGFEL